MSSRRRAQLQVIETPPERAVTRLHQLIRHRDLLRIPFRDCWTVISADAADAHLERWAEGSLELAFVNAGPECQLAFWRMSVDLRSELSLNSLADFAHAAADICRGAGAQAALACRKPCPSPSEDCRRLAISRFGLAASFAWRAKRRNWSWRSRAEPTSSCRPAIVRVLRPSSPPDLSTRAVTARGGGLFLRWKTAWPRRPWSKQPALSLSPAMNVS